MVSLEIFSQAMLTHQTACSTDIDLLKSDFVLLASMTVKMYCNILQQRAFTARIIP
jgi:hypothetical protein